MPELSGQPRCHVTRPREKHIRPAGQPVPEKTAKILPGNTYLELRGRVHAALPAERYSDGEHNADTPHG